MATIVLLSAFTGCKSSLIKKNDSFRLSEEPAIENYSNNSYQEDIKALAYHQTENHDIAVSYKDSIYSLTDFKNTIGFHPKNKFNSVKVIKDSSIIVDEFSVEGYRVLLLVQ